MESINVLVSSPYNVLVSSDILKDTGKFINEIKNSQKAVIISDDNVFPLYGPVVENSLRANGFTVLNFVFKAGESSKNFETAIDILNFLAKEKISRTDILIALGGGVVGDIAGFCSAIYLRGIDYVQIPTSLLACVDSSVGGKTGIDLTYGKNLVGAFKQPISVICDTNVFKTLSFDLIQDGLGEIIKYGATLDKNLFKLLKTGKLSQNINEIVGTCIKLKAKIVVEDEFDTGLRQILNFGHTMGHGIESLSNFNISHGKAVCMGMYYLQRAFNKNLATEIKSLLDIYKIDVTCPYSAKEIANKALNDKKILNGKINLILLKEIGKCEIVPTDTSTLTEIFERGLANED